MSNFSAYDEKQNRKRQSIKNRPLFLNSSNSSAQFSPSNEIMSSLTVQAMEQKLSSQKKMSTMLFGITRKNGGSGRKSESTEIVETGCKSQDVNINTNKNNQLTRNSSQDEDSRNNIRSLPHTSLCDYSSSEDDNNSN